MSKENKLFNFMFGLQGCAQMELKRQSVQDLPAAMAVTNFLVNYKLSSPSTMTQKWRNVPIATIRPHKVRDCPKKKKINVVIVANEENSESETPTRVNPLQFLNAIRVETHKGLMYVKIAMGGQKFVALVGSGATHNFVSVREATRLDLKLSKDDSTINFLSVSLDDFDFISGNDFFHRSKVALLPHLNGMYIMDEMQPYYVHGLKITLEKMVEVLDGIVSILQEYANMMPSKLPMKLPPKRPIDRYWQVRIAKEDESKTTCVTLYGNYEFLVMPFRLTNTLATFYNLMNDVDGSKVAIIWDWLAPTKVMELRSFLREGMEMGTGVQIAFQRLKDVITLEPTLRLSDLELPFEIQTNASNRALRGLLHPLRIPERPWQCLSIDFITGCPKVQGYRSILVVVDRFSKYAMFILVPHECAAKEVGRLFFNDVAKYFGILEDIVSDKDSRFTGKFWVELFKMMGAKFKFSTTNHPQTDEQTKRMSYNLHQSSTIGKSPFEVVIGLQPHMPMDMLANYQPRRCLSSVAYKYAKT
ncbi:hypothetical protein AAG906_036934 [Vitis piasezkii]